MVRKHCDNIRYLTSMLKKNKVTWIFFFLFWHFGPPIGENAVGLGHVDLTVRNTGMLIIFNLVNKQSAVLRK